MNHLSLQTPINMYEIYFKRSNLNFDRAVHFYVKESMSGYHISPPEDVHCDEGHSIQDDPYLMKHLITSFKASMIHQGEIRGKTFDGDLHLEHVHIIAQGMLDKLADELLNPSTGRSETKSMLSFSNTFFEMNKLADLTFFSNNPETRDKDARADFNLDHLKQFRLWLVEDSRRGDAQRIGTIPFLINQVYREMVRVLVSVGRNKDAKMIDKQFAKLLIQKEQGKLSANDLERIEAERIQKKVDKAISKSTKKGEKAFKKANKKVRKAQNKLHKLTAKLAETTMANPELEEDDTDLNEGNRG